MAAGGAPIQLVNLRDGAVGAPQRVAAVITFGRGQDEAKYRFNWHCPIVIDPFDPETVFVAAEDGVPQQGPRHGLGGHQPGADEGRPLQAEARRLGRRASETSGQEAYNTIHRMVCSTIRKRVSDVDRQRRRPRATSRRTAGQDVDGYTNLPVPDDSDVYELEASPHDPATCYVAR